MGRVSSSVVVIAEVVLVIVVVVVVVVCESTYRNAIDGAKHCITFLVVDKLL
jgi:hypothetical protein